MLKYNAHSAKTARMAKPLAGMLYWHRKGEDLYKNVCASGKTEQEGAKRIERHGKTQLERVEPRDPKTGKQKTV